MRIGVLLVFVVGCGGGSSAKPPDAAAGGDGPPPHVDGAVPISPSCGPLPMPAGHVVDVTPAQAGQLGDIVLAAQPGDVIRFADGTYPVSADVVMNVAQPGVTLISASRDASKVIIDGGAHDAREIIQVSASNVTIAHLTIRNARDHLVHLYPGGGADLGGITLYGLTLIDAGQQFVKSNTDKSNAELATAHFVDGVTVACSTFTMTAAGRAYVPANPDNASYPCYTGGIDAHAAAGWIVRKNRFEGIYCEPAVGSLAEHAIHFWQTGRDQLIEQNTIVNCARGIGLGLGDGTGLIERPYADMPHAADKQGPYAGNYDGIVRGNFVYADVAAFDSGISVEQAMGVRIYHDTVIATGAAAGNAIEYRFPNSLVDIEDVLATAIVMRDGGRGVASHDGLAPPLADFVDPASGDLHLAAGANDAIDQGVTLAEAGLDIDGDAYGQGAAPDLGADER